MKVQTLFTGFLLIFIFAISSCQKDKPDPVDPEIPTNPTNPPKEIVTEHITIPPDLESPTIKKGYYGHHLKWKRMPAPDHVVTVPSYGYGENLPVTNELYVFPPLTHDQLKEAVVKNSIASYKINKVPQKPFYIITPNNKGFYQIDLPIGLYSAFMKLDDSTLYGSTIMSGYNHIMPFNMEKEQLLERDFLLNIDQYR